MIPIIAPFKGKYTTAKVMIDKIDSTTMQQIFDFINHPAFTNPVAVMPDCHAGKGAVIGFTMKLTDKVIPNVIGVDIGCGMLSVNMGKKVLNPGLGGIDVQNLDERIREAIPFGTSVRKNIYPFFNDKSTLNWNYINHKLAAAVTKWNGQFNTDWAVGGMDEETFKNMCEKIGMDYDRARLSVGTLGGGNHFIELGKSEETGDYWLTIHSGSRQFGLKVANYHQKKAGKGQMAYLEGADAVQYFIDMLIAQEYANHNRLIMFHAVRNLFQHFISIMPQNPVDQITTVHNYISPEDFIIRKGAISAYKNERMIIPFNMEDGILLCKGKSNAEWNFSAPHGAGRVGSRKWAKENLSQKDAEHNMKKKGIYFSKLPIDEVKGAYKDSAIIENAIDPTAEIIDRWKPVLNMKE